MKITFKKFLSVFTAGVLVFSASAPAVAQKNNAQRPRAVPNLETIKKMANGKADKEENSLNKLFAGAQQKRKDTETLSRWARKANNTNTYAHELAAILEDAGYIASEDVYDENFEAQSIVFEDEDGVHLITVETEMGIFIPKAQEIKFSAADAQMLVAVVAEKLKTDSLKNDSLSIRYAFIAAAFLHNRTTGRAMFDAAVNILKSNIPVGCKTGALKTLTTLETLTAHQKRTLAKEIPVILNTLGHELKKLPNDNYNKPIPINNQVVAAKIGNNMVSQFKQRLATLSGYLLGRKLTLWPGEDGQGVFYNTEMGVSHKLAFVLTKMLFAIYKSDNNKAAMFAFMHKYLKLSYTGKQFDNYLLFSLYGFQAFLGVIENEAELVLYEKEALEYLHALETTLDKVAPGIGIAPMF
ncbi:hypothetical protein AAIR98_000559 [Elusimicrobium simillimum]|uniref:hypothetical protein n=1 Tax=Elusimicrobium simillimum TaxID=3143438 RepID=UPI003C6EDB9A